MFWNRSAELAALQALDAGLAVIWGRPYGEPPRGGKRSLYKIDDPFLRLWFRVVAPNRAALMTGTRASRLAHLDVHWTQLLAQAWEELCRSEAAAVARGPLAKLGPWHPAQRYWHGAEPEWDVIADGVDSKRTLVGEAWFVRKPPALAALRHAAQALEARPLPPAIGRREVTRALFVPRIGTGTPRTIGSVHIVTQSDLIRTRVRDRVSRADE